jgi:hypothetical protein
VGIPFGRLDFVVAVAIHLWANVPSLKPSVSQGELTNLAEGTHSAEVLEQSKLDHVGHRGRINKRQV